MLSMWGRASFLYIVLPVPSNSCMASQGSP